ncbi:amino acid/polyamine/organocation transporter, APC superfamily [Roseovarius pacificus]|uniref:Amino acid/polyamine/organocation transporter, APC superfamily n=1 Tax=Roseovarius pacificus TaxID=337701 RepID=A0A1M7FQL3_9RHOB|nr:amino acid permease [Roseovarius pacificus]GGO59352.1 transporter [Roseovarius pacificus]SHM06412.1 amino acid/polyamine/organocation transporter, APC superfamily [Roseovarius pacificus]
MSDQTANGSATAAVEAAVREDRVGLLRVLGPVHVWALGVGIVLVGEFMGWNFSVGKGGAMGALIACWVIGLLYTCVAMIDSEVTSTVAAAGGQYAQAKHIMGPLMAFNVGLYLVMAYTMLEAADALIVGDLLVILAEQTGYEALDPKPFVILIIAFLAFLNYRGVFMTLTLNFIITAAAFVSIIILFLGVQPWQPGAMLKHSDLLTDLPYGWIGVIAAFQFGIWYYLGIEGTCQAAEEVRSPSRSLPLGTMTGIMTLLIAATLTWYVCSGLLPWEYLGQATVPLYDAARMTGSTTLQIFLFVGTMFAATASANGCINDASRAWFSMGRDRYMPLWFGAVHPRYRTPYRSILFLIPIAVSFAFTGLLDQVITFSILSGLLGYTFMPINMVIFRKKWPLGTIRRGYVHPFHPIPAIVLMVLCITTFFATYLGFGVQLLAMMVFYIVVSIWFSVHRYKYVRRSDQFTMNWPKPQGY